MWPWSSSVALGLMIATFASPFGSRAVQAAQLAVTSTSTASHGPCTHSAYPVPNGNFQSGRLPPWTPDPQAYRVNFSVIRISPPAENYALRLQAVASGTAAPRGAITLDNITVCAATAYNLTFLYRSLQTTPGCNAYVTAVGYGSYASDFQWSYADLNATNGFQKGSVRLRLESGNGYNIYVLLACTIANPSGLAAIDFREFELHATRSLEAPGCPNQAATLSNGNFETGDTAPWQLYQYNNQTTAGVVYTPHSLRDSRYNLRVNFSASPLNSNSTGDEGFNLIQAIPDLCVAYEYEVSLDYRWTSPHLAQIPKSAFISVIIQSCGSVDIPPGNGAWQSISLTCLAARNTNTTIEASFVIGYGSGQPAYPAFAIDLDNISFRLSSS